MHSLHRTAALPVALLVALSLLGGAAAGSGASREAGPLRSDDRTALHVLNRLGFGARPGDLERVRMQGLERYLQAQLQPQRIADDAIHHRLSGLEATRKGTRELFEEYFAPALLLRRQRRAGTAGAAETREQPRPGLAPADAIAAERAVLQQLAGQKILRAVYSARQLEEVMVDFWFNHFNVFAGKGPTRIYLTEYERDVIRPHVLGRFRDLLGATAASPAMLFYLDNWQSAAADGAPTTRRAPPRRAGAPLMPGRARRGINENYARELLELHTLGVDGPYSQRDVQEVARAFTGWTIANPRQGGGFRFEPRLHDAGAKVVLGRRIAAGGGIGDGEQVLDLLASHPATARHVAGKLARRFIADAPPRSIVDRAAARFLETGGDIREVVRTIVTSREFFAPEAQRAKTKTPFEFVVSALRATDADVIQAQPLVAVLRDLGMPLYRCAPPSGYADTAAAWVNGGALLARLNFSLALAEGRMRGIHLPDRAADSGAAIAETLSRAALAGQLSATARAAATRASTPAQAIALVLGSPEFQKR